MQKWVNRLATKRAPATVRQAKLLLGMIFAHAVEEGYIAKTPVRGIKFPKIEKTGMRIFDADEVRRLADAIDTR